MNLVKLCQFLTIYSTLSNQHGIKQTRPLKYTYSIMFDGFTVEAKVFNGYCSNLANLQKIYHITMIIIINWINQNGNPTITQINKDVNYT